MISSRITSLKKLLVPPESPFPAHISKGSKKKSGEGRGGAKEGINPTKTPINTTSTNLRWQPHRPTYYCSCLLLSIAAYSFAASLVER